MRSLVKMTMKLLGLALLLCANAQGQGVKLDLGQLDRLSPKAAESIEINLDSALLQVAAKFFSPKKPEEAAIKELIAGLKGVYVKVLEFDQAGAYSATDLEPLRAQLRAPGWSRIVGVRSQRDGENVEVYTWLEDGKITALAIIAAEPKELTVVNIIGLIELDKLSQLSEYLNLPRLELERADKPRKK